MSGDHAAWTTVKQIFQSALDQPPERRLPFVRERCGGNATLLREVESMLLAHERAGDAGERPAIDALLTSEVEHGYADAAARVLSPGLRLGPYEVGDRIGRGGMGEVYRGLDTRLGRTVAIKILAAHGRSDAEGQQRFKREAQTLAAISHPHICPIYDVGRQDDVDYLVMEHLDGETLAERLTRGPVPLDQALRYSSEIADALCQAHRRGIVHRDLKPGNVMLTARGAVLLDFGLAKRSVAAVAGAHATGVRTAPLTTAGTIVGTLHYMAPEQVQGRDADARSDIFAFGAMLYEMLAGRPLFAGANFAAVIHAVLYDTMPVLTGSPAVAALDRVLH